MFHALYKKNEDIKVESDEIFSSLKNNAVMQTFDRLLEDFAFVMCVNCIARNAH